MRILIRNEPRTLRDFTSILASEFVHSLTISVTRTFTHNFKQREEKKGHKNVYT